MRPSRRGRWRLFALVLVHVVFLVHLAHWKVAGSTLTPLEPSEAKQTLELGYVNAGFVLLLLSILVTLVVGRFFCGWACHVVAYQDACAWLLGKLRLRPRAIRSRLLMALPFLAAFDMFLLPTLLRWWSGGERPGLVAHFFTADLWESFPGLTIGALTFFVDGFLVVWFLGAKGFCTNACPYGALFAVAGRAAPGRIRVNDDCEGCGHCTAVCTSNVRVHEEVARFGQVVDPGCMRCMDCVSSCPKDALAFAFQPRRARDHEPRAAKPRPRRAPRRSWDFSFWEELVLGVLCLAGVYAFRGLYSQVPLMLALGLGVLVAVSALTLARVLRRRDFQVQGAVLRRAGRLTPGGALTVLGLLVFLAFAAHSLAVNGASRYGGWMLAGAEGADPDTRRARIERGASFLSFADAAGLVRDPEVAYGLGLVELGSGRYRESYAPFEEAIERAPRRPGPYLGMAEAALQVRDLERAERALSALLELQPEHVRGRWRRAQLAIMRRDFEQAERLLEELCADAPDHAAARFDLERVRSVLGR